jgi:hypothetical protein
MRHASLTLLALVALLGACTSAISSSGSGGPSSSASGARGASSTGSGPTSTSTSTGTGASSSGGSSTGASTGSTGGTGGASTGGCLSTPDGGPSLYLGANCATDATCCGLVCNQAMGMGSCQPTCVITADCPLPTTLCDTDAGQCTPAYCGDLDGGGFNEPCDLEDAGDGNCVAGAILSSLGPYLGLCTESGTAATGTDCGANSYRDQPSELCVRGDVCTYPSAVPTPMCAQNCSLLVADAGCPAGKTCQPYWEGGDGFTACL